MLALLPLDAVTLITAGIPALPPMPDTCVTVVFDATVLPPILP